MSDSWWPHELYSPWNSPVQNTGVSSPSLLQGIFPTQVSRIAGGFFTSWATIARCPTLRVDSLPAEPQKQQRILEGIAYPFSRGSSTPRDWTKVSCIEAVSLPLELSGKPIAAAAAAAAKSLQSCLILCDPIDGSPPGSHIPGILQARTLEWVAFFCSNAWKWKMKVKSLSPVWLLATPWTAAYQAPPSMGFSRQEYWSGVLLPSPREAH